MYANDNEIDGIALEVSREDSAANGPVANWIAIPRVNANRAIAQPGADFFHYAGNADDAVSHVSTHRNAAAVFSRFRPSEVAVRNDGF